VMVHREVRHGLGWLYLWAARRLYNELALLYDPVSGLVSAGHWGEWRRIALDYVTRPPVLEVGFGTGQLLLELAQRHGSAYGIDLSRAMHRIAARRLRRRGLAAHRVRGQAQALPFENGSFETIVCTFPAEYIADPRSLRELRRVLRRPDGAGGPGGRLVIVGLAVYRTGAPLQSGFRVPRTDTALERLCGNMRSAGLAVGLISRFAGTVRVPVIVAERWP
jgi:ubiquinone/menaquinone biosynthesis C-methylase UbiE